MSRRAVAWMAVMGAVVVLAAFFLGGGVYRTTHTMGDVVYVVNRFTGRGVRIAGGVASPVGGSAQERKERILEEARAVGARYVGERGLGVFHTARPQLAWWGECEWWERDSGGREYFTNSWEAAGGVLEKLRPCEKCFPRVRMRVTAATAAVRARPKGDAQVWFTVKRGEKLVVWRSAAHGEWYPTATESGATGEPGVGWVLSSQLGGEEAGREE